MKLKDQVCGLEQAWRLKELGVKQESTYYHMSYLRNNEEHWRFQFDFPHRFPVNRSMSAFTVAELGELIDWNIVAVSAPYKDQREWFLCTDDHDEFHISEAQVRAAMLIYLLENKLM